MKKTKDTQYLFLSANIRALQTKMIGTQALQKMISAASLRRLIRRSMMQASAPTLIIRISNLR